MLIDEIGPPAGGAERFATGLATSLARDRYQVVMCITRPAHPEAHLPLEHAGVEVVNLRRRFRLDLPAFRPLIRLLRSRDFHVIHAHKFGSNVWGVLFGRLFRVPVIVAHEQTWSYRGKPHRVVLDSLIGRLATKFVAVSSADRDRMISIERVPDEQITVIPNPYIPRSDGGGGNLRAELGLRPEIPVIGTVGLMRPQKALEVLIDAFGLVSATRPLPHLVIAGDGPCRARLEKQVAMLELTERVHFLGVREDLDNLLEAFDIAAMSSDFEGTPLFALECMAHRVPLVATEVGGLPDLIENGRSGILVPQRDPEQFAQAIVGLVDDAQRRTALADAAYERSRDLTLDRITRRFGDLYTELLAAQSA